MVKKTGKTPKRPEKRERKKMALGRGLDALFPDMDDLGDAQNNDYFQCDIDMISPNPYQPRATFPREELEELSLSIKSQGVIQPLLVRKSNAGYELVAGERRLRASKLAGLSQVPVVIRNLSDTQMLEVSIVENIQRENLNPMDEAEAYKRLLSEFKLTQEQIAMRVGKSRSAVANFLRLCHLPDQIKASLKDGLLAMGHARALLGADTPAQQKIAWSKVVSRGLSVRETEALIKKLKQDAGKEKKSRTDPDSAYFSDLSADLSRHYGTKVEIKRKGKKGKVEIEFYTDEDLDRLLELLKN